MCIGPVLHRNAMIVSMREERTTLLCSTAQLVRMLTSFFLLVLHFHVLTKPTTSTTYQYHA